MIAAVHVTSSAITMALIFFPLYRMPKAHNGILSFIQGSLLTKAPREQVGCSEATIEAGKRPENMTRNETGWSGVSNR